MKELGIYLVIILVLWIVSAARKAMERAQSKDGTAPPPRPSFRRVEESLRELVEEKAEDQEDQEDQEDEEDIEEPEEADEEEVETPAPAPVPAPIRRPAPAVRPAPGQPVIRRIAYLDETPSPVTRGAEAIAATRLPSSRAAMSDAEGPEAMSAEDASRFISAQVTHQVRPGAEQAPRRRAQAARDLPLPARLTPMQKAVLMAELLGTPPGLRETPPGPPMAA